MSSDGGAVDFGDLSFARSYPAGANSSTRGLFLYAYAPKTNSIGDISSISSSDESHKLEIIKEEIEIKNLPKGSSSSLTTSRNHVSKFE